MLTMYLSLSLMAYSSMPSSHGKSLRKFSCLLVSLGYSVNITKLLSSIPERHQETTYYEAALGSALLASLDTLVRGVFIIIPHFVDL